MQLAKELVFQIGHTGRCIPKWQVAIRKYSRLPFLWLFYTGIIVKAWNMVITVLFSIFGTVSPTILLISFSRRVPSDTMASMELIYFHGADNRSADMYVIYIISKFWLQIDFISFEQHASTRCSSYYRMFITIFIILDFNHTFCHKLQCFLNINVDLLYPCQSDFRRNPNAVQRPVK